MLIDRYKKLYKKKAFTLQEFADRLIVNRWTLSRWIDRDFNPVTKTRCGNQNKRHYVCHKLSHRLNTIEGLVNMYEYIEKLKEIR